jgi:hypothetical protein
VELIRGLGFKIIRGCGIAAVSNLSRIIKSHLADGVPENVLGEGHGLFRGPVHAYYKFVDLRTITHKPERLFDPLQRLWHQNLDRLVKQEAIQPAGLASAFSVPSFNASFNPEPIFASLSPPTESPLRPFKIPSNCALAGWATHSASSNARRNVVSLIPLRFVIA